MLRKFLIFSLLVLIYFHPQLHFLSRQIPTSELNSNGKSFFDYFFTFLGSFILYLMLMHIIFNVDVLRNMNEIELCHFLNSIT